MQENQGQPAVALGHADAKGHVPHPQARVTSFQDVLGIPGDAKQEKIAQSRFGTLPVIARIHRREQVVGFHTSIKARHHATDAFLADRLDYEFFVRHKIQVFSLLSLRCSESSPEPYGRGIDRTHYR